MVAGSSYASLQGSSGYPPTSNYPPTSDYPPASGYPPDGVQQPEAGYPSDTQEAGSASGEYLTNGEATDNVPSAGSYYPPEVTVDETGQAWYFDYNQQQWFPYQEQLQQELMQQQLKDDLQQQSEEQLQQAQQSSASDMDKRNEFESVAPDQQYRQQQQQLQEQQQEEYNQQLMHEQQLHEQQLHEQQMHEQQLHEQQMHEQQLHEQQLHEQQLHEQQLLAEEMQDRQASVPALEAAQAAPLQPEVIADLTAGVQQLSMRPPLESHDWEASEKDPRNREQRSAADWGRQDSRLSSGSVEGAAADHRLTLGGEESAVRPENHSAGGEAATLGPPDLVDHRPTTSQPEIVSDLARPPLGGFMSPLSGSRQLPYAASVPPPDMFASLPGAADAASPLPLSSQKSSGPDLTPSGGPPQLPPPFMPPPSYGLAPDVMPTAPPLSASFSGFAPDITAQSVIQNNGSANHSQLHSNQSAAAAAGHQQNDQHYDFYNRPLDPSAVAMPDIMAGRVGGGGHLSPPSLLPSLANLRPAADGPQSSGKAPDILRTEPPPPPAHLVPSSDRNVYMETGELMEEDAARVSLQQQQQSHHSSSHIQQPHHPPPPLAFPKPSSGLPPMDGGNELLLLANEERLVVGESDAVATPANSSQRMVEGESSSSSARPPLPVLATLRQVEGESGQQEPLLSMRTIEGEDGPPPPPQQQLPPPPLTSAPVHRGAGVMPSAASPPLTSATSRVVAPGHPSPQQLHQAASSSGESPSLFSSTILDSSPIYPPGRGEARSAAAGSERRDQTMMGGPPPARLSKAPPLPTPGRDIAGEEAVASSAYSGGARRRGDQHKKSTYDSDDVDRNQDSDLESDRDREPRYPAPRRTVSPGW
jgi:hypothetical protein